MFRTGNGIIQTDMELFLALHGHWPNTLFYNMFQSSLAFQIGSSKQEIESSYYNFNKLQEDSVYLAGFQFLGTTRSFIVHFAGSCLFSEKMNLLNKQVDYFIDSWINYN